MRRPYDRLEAGGVGSAIEKRVDGRAVEISVGNED